MDSLCPIPEYLGVFGRNVGIKGVSVGQIVEETSLQTALGVPIHQDLWALFHKWILEGRFPLGPRKICIKVLSFLFLKDHLCVLGINGLVIFLGELVVGEKQSLESRFGVPQHSASIVILHERIIELFLPDMPRSSRMEILTIFFDKDNGHDG